MRTFALTVLLLALTGFAFADDDPEPPAASLRKLQGTWNSVRRIIGGEEMPYTQVTYAFEKDKATHTLGSGKQRTLTVKADRKRSDVIEMTPDKGKTARYFFKIEKGELYLTPTRSTDPNVKPDFSGAKGTVIIYQRAKAK